MARLRQEQLLAPRRALAWLPDKVRRILYAGITTPNRLVRRRQMFTNVLAGVAAANAVVHLVANSVHDFDGLAAVNAYNAAMFVFCIVNHRLHALGNLVAAIVLLIGIAIGHSFVVFAFGTASDLHVYFTLAGFVLFLVGAENMRLFLAIFAMFFVALLISIFLAPENGFVLTGDVELRRSLSFQALVTAIVMNGVLITAALSALHRAEELSEGLLTTILPERISERLKSSPDRRIADRVNGCSVMFLDLVGFTQVTNELEPEEVVAYLDRIFTAFDASCERHGVDKIKTIGDSYMAVAGLEGDPREAARDIGRVALEFAKTISEAPVLGEARLRMRAGIHSGPVTAGIIGNIRISYDVWGDTVNTASRMESHGIPGRIHVSDAFRRLAEPWFVFEARGEIEVKSLGLRSTHFLIASKHAGFEAMAQAANDPMPVPPHAPDANSA